MNCPKCNAVLSERGAFCKTCGAQARCLKCKDILEPAAVACVECGTVVGQGAEITVAEPGLAANRNTISFQEDRNSRTFSASLTDHAVGGLSDALADFFLHRGGRPAVTPRTGFNREIVIDQPPALPPGQDPTPPPAPQIPVSGDKVLLGKIFRETGQAINLIDRRLKAKNGQDFVKRLTYLLLYSHELHGRPSTLRTDVIAALKEGKCWDSNASHWLNKNIGFKPVGEDDRLELLGEGRDGAKKYLVEIHDDGTADDWNPDKKVKTKRAPRTKKADAKK